MPELPEVQTVVVDLKSKLVNQKIGRVQIFWPKTFCLDASLIEGQVVQDVLRRGKYIIIKLVQGFLVVHLRMTGRLFVVPATELVAAAYQRHLQVSIELQNSVLLFQDQRKFGRMHFYHDVDWLDARLGPEPLTPSFTVAYLAKICQSKKQIKVLLLDQAKIAGLGNIYVDEVLWYAAVHPQALASDLATKKTKLIHHGIKEILQQAIEMQGTTFLSYAFDGIKKGNFLTKLRVFNRAKQPCFRCGTPIVKIKVAQRGTHVCVQCQCIAGDRKKDEI